MRGTIAAAEVLHALASHVQGRTCRLSAAVQVSVFRRISLNTLGGGPASANL